MYPCSISKEQARSPRRCGNFRLENGEATFYLAAHRRIEQIPAARPEGLCLSGLTPVTGPSNRRRPRGIASRLRLRRGASPNARRAYDETGRCRSAGLEAWRAVASARSRPDNGPKPCGSCTRRAANRPRCWRSRRRCRVMSFGRPSTPSSRKASGSETSAARSMQLELLFRERSAGA